jgi:ATP-dependent DNA helicase PIF1
MDMIQNDNTEKTPQPEMVENTEETPKKIIYLSQKPTTSAVAPLGATTAMDIAELSPEQRIAYTKFTRGENLFITGPGGTGKTRLVKHFIRYANSCGNSIPVCAMTGCAAVLLNCNASTLHSWSGIRLAKGSKESIINSVLRNQNAKKSWKKAKGLILDEVSMLSKKIFEIIEEIARITHSTSTPFGGMQVIFTGDFFQLPPVGTEDEPETEQFCFESAKWTKVFPLENQIELTTLFRQKDPVYIRILNQIRRGEIDEESRATLLQYVNRVYVPEEHNGCIPTKIFALRSKTDYVNSQMFSKLKEKEYIFESNIKTDCKTYIESAKAIETDKLARCLEMTTRDVEIEIDTLKRNTSCQPLLRLKKGAAVMCTVNLDMDQSICNGSQGIVVDILENVTVVGHALQVSVPVVKFANGVIKNIYPYYWQSETYPTVAISQYPLCLAWAITIHKIQGATLAMAEMDIGQSIFEYGQTYVALSRIQSLEGLYLTAFHPQKIKANPKVIEFYRRIQQVNHGIVSAKQGGSDAEGVAHAMSSSSSSPTTNPNIKKITL